MAKFLSILAVSAALMLAGSVTAATKKAGPKTYQGTVKMVRTDGIKVDFGDNKPLDVFGIRGPNTVVTANGAAATWDDLATGQYVSITIAGGVATKIDIGGASTAAPTKSKKKT